MGNLVRQQLFHLLIYMNVVEDRIIQRHQSAAVMEMLHKYAFARDIFPVVELLLKKGSFQVIDEIDAWRIYRNCTKIYL